MGRRGRGGAGEIKTAKSRSCACLILWNRLRLSTWQPPGAQPADPAARRSGGHALSHKQLGGVASVAAASGLMPQGEAHRGGAGEGPGRSTAMGALPQRQRTCLDSDQASSLPVPDTPLQKRLCHSNTYFLSMCTQKNKPSSWDDLNVCPWRSQACVHNKFPFRRRGTFPSSCPMAPTFLVGGSPATPRL